MGLFTEKTLMITGGTGSFGNVVLNRFLKINVGEIRIFSRDEKKQDDMCHHFQVTMSEVAEKIKFYIGDVRFIESVRSAMRELTTYSTQLHLNRSFLANFPDGSYENQHHRNG
jgi:UDP-glucose 4-epimerase